MGKCKSLLPAVRRATTRVVKNCFKGKTLEQIDTSRQQYINEFNSEKFNNGVKDQIILSANAKANMKAKRQQKKLKKGAAAPTNVAISLQSRPPTQTAKTAKTAKTVTEQQARVAAMASSLGTARKAPVLSAVPEETGRTTPTTRIHTISKNRHVIPMTSFYTRSNVTVGPMTGFPTGPTSTRAPDNININMPTRQGMQTKAGKERLRTGGAAAHKTGGPAQRR